MNFKIAVVTVIYLSVLAAQNLPTKNTIITNNPLEELEDSVTAETGFASPAASQQGSKFFQYINTPGKDQVNHGHKKGNEHHFIERHEKERPHEGEFKTKVRWGDKHGGYGEHYWDYNHGGHGDGDESQHNEEYAEYEEESKAHPVVSPIQDILRDKREPALTGDVEFINNKARSLVLDPTSQKHGGNYRAANDFRSKREQSRRQIQAQAKTPSNFGESLVFDAEEGVVVDKETGAKYKLSPIP